MTVQLFVSAASSVMLAACAAASPPGDNAGDSPPAHGVASGHTCDRSNIQQFVGRQATADLGARMMRVSGAGVLRWVPYRTAVTMEFSPDRLTVFLDENNRVERISCS